MVGELLTIDSEKAFFSLLRTEYSKLFPRLGDRTRVNRTKRNLYSVINKIREYIYNSISIIGNKGYIVNQYLDL